MNTTTHSSSVQSSRFKDAPWFNEIAERVIVGGAGGIGSWLSFFLVRAGFEPIIYDFDTVEEHNLGGQLFRQKDVGRLKIEATADIINTFSNKAISGFALPVDITTPHHHFAFSAFDNMKARRDLFEVWKKSHAGASVTPLLIDGRLTMEQVQILCVTPENMDRYEQEYLFDDSEVEDAACTLRSTTHSAALIASLMTGFFTNHISNINERKLIRTVPFYYEFFIPQVLTDLIT